MVAAGLLSQPLAGARAVSRSILHPNPLKNNLLMCQRKIRFQCVSGHYGFITCNKFQAAVLLINIQCLCVCVLQGYQMDYIVFYFNFSITCISGPSQSTGLRGDVRICPSQQTFHLFVLLCLFFIFFCLLVCVLKWSVLGGWR